MRSRFCEEGWPNPPFLMHSGHKAAPVGQQVPLGAVPVIYDDFGSLAEGSRA